VKQSVEAIATPLLATTAAPAPAALQAPESTVLSLDKAIDTLDELQVSPAAKK
jgi:hypothetical protein